MVGSVAADVRPGKLVDWLPLALALGAAALAIGLRLYGLSADTLSHPEIYVPGIPLPPDISEPPPRLDLPFTLWWHFHDEPHPMGWYLAMFGWTKLFGVSEWSLRLPSVISAGLSIPLMYAVGRHAYAAPVGVVAAFALALHGFHIHWSGIARMYAAGAFLALLATYLLMRLRTSDRPSPGLEFAYVVALIAGTQTTELFWAIAVMHVAWLTLPPDQPNRFSWGYLIKAPLTRVTRLAEVQSIALMIAAPSLSHAVYRSRSGAAPDPSLDFLREYFSFGFLFANDDGAMPHLEVAPLLTIPLLVGSLVLIGLSLRRTRNDEALPAKTPGVPVWLRAVIALASCGLMLWLSTIAHRRGVTLAALSVLPFLFLWIPGLVAAAGSFLNAYAPAPRRLVERMGADVSLLFILGALTPLLAFAASFKASVLADRAFLVFVPFLLLLVSAGAWGASRRPVARGAILAALAMLFAASIMYSAEKPSSNRDYKGLAEKMAARMKPSDIILLRRRHWQDTPLFYYLPNREYVVENYEQALAAKPGRRVWLVTWPNEETPVVADERRKALAGYERLETVSARRASAELFAPGGRP